jgi:hypothetical protein
VRLASGSGFPSIYRLLLVHDIKPSQRPPPGSPPCAIPAPRSVLLRLASSRGCPMAGSPRTRSCAVGYRGLVGRVHNLQERPIPTATVQQDLVNIKVNMFSRTSSTSRSKFLMPALVSIQCSLSNFHTEPIPSNRSGTVGGWPGLAVQWRRAARTSGCSFDLG